MISSERIRIMTKLSSFEEREGKDIIPVITCFKNDYIVKNMIWTAVTTTIAYILVLVLWFACKFTYYLNNLAQMNLIHLAVRLVIFYLVALVTFEVLAYFVYDYKYQVAKKKQKPYSEGLKALEALYEKEDKAKLGCTTSIGGVAKHDIS